MYKGATDVEGLYMEKQSFLICASLLIAACIIALSGRHEVVVVDYDSSVYKVLIVDTLFGNVDECWVSYRADATCLDLKRQYLQRNN